MAMFGEIVVLGCPTTIAVAVCGVVGAVNGGGVRRAGGGGVR